MHQFGAVLGHVVTSTRSDYHLGAVEILERFLPSYWWTDPTSTIEGPLVQAVAVLLGLVFVLAIATWIGAPRIGMSNRVVQRLLVRLAKWVAVLAAIGLFLLLFRWQLVPFLSKRLWMILWSVAVIALPVYAYLFWRRRYPELIAAWEDTERRRRYLPKPATGGSRSRRRSRRRR